LCPNGFKEPVSDKNVKMGTMRMLETNRDELSFIGRGFDFLCRHTFSAVLRFANIDSAVLIGCSLDGIFGSFAFEFAPEDTVSVNVEFGHRGYLHVSQWDGKSKNRREMDRNSAVPF